MVHIDTKLVVEKSSIIIFESLERGVNVYQ